MGFNGLIEQPRTTRANRAKSGATHPNGDTSIRRLRKNRGINETWGSTFNFRHSCNGISQIVVIITIIVVKIIVI
jgi:hypothetical protein